MASEGLKVLSEVLGVAEAVVLETALILLVDVSEVLF